MGLVVNWIFYILGISLVVAPKIVKFKRTHGYESVWKALWCFFTEDGEASGVTASTAAAYFVLGAWYLGLIYWSEPQTFIPVHWSISFFIGTIAELAAPVIVEQFIKAIKEGISRLFGDKK